MHVKNYKPKIHGWLNRTNTYKQVMELIYSVIYGQSLNTTKQKLEIFSVFEPTRDKQDYESAIFYWI